MELYFPTELGEQAAFVAAALTALFGLLPFLLPRAALRLTAFQVGEVRAEGYASVRAAGGRCIGLGLAAILLAQDWIYLTLGAAFAVAALGRVISVLFDRAFTLRNAVFLAVEALLAAAPLAYVFGYL